VTLSGGEVRSLIADLLTGKQSRLFAAVRKTYSLLKVPVAEETSRMCDWEATLGYWARAMDAAYTLHATPEIRQTFRENVRYYVIAKAGLTEKLVWYDWQLFSIMTHLFDRYGSLMMVSQEGMEAVQKQNNALQRNGNNYANVGRTPLKVLAQGLEAIKAYMAERAKRMKTPCQWLWKRQYLTFVAEFSHILDRVEACRAEGKTMEWKDFDEEWAYFAATARVAGQLTAHYKLYRRKRTHIGMSYGAQLLGEHRAYYAPCECELDPAFWKMRPKDAKKRLQKERSQRWTQRASVRKARAEAAHPAP
jgi:hypothetical protein